jgi:hypothetical protein
MKFLDLLFFAAIAFLLYTSCKKNSSDNPVADKLTGKWKYTYFVADSNHNHIMDAHDAIDTIRNNPTIIEYYPDGTGAYLLNGASAASFTWQLLDNNTYLKVSGLATGSATQHIDSLTATKLVLRDTTGISYTWQVYTKQ